MILERPVRTLAAVSTRDPLVAFPLLAGLGEGLRRAGSSFEKAGVNLESLLDRRCCTATDATAPESPRLEGCRFARLRRGY